MKSIRLSQLEAYSLDRVAKVAWACLIAEGVQDALLMGREIVGRGRRKPLQQARVARFRLCDAPFSLRRRGAGIEAQHLVDQAEIPIVVQQALVGGDLGIDANPKAHVLLELRWMRERIGRLGACRKVVEERREQQPERRYLD